MSPLKSKAMGMAKKSQKNKSVQNKEKKLGRSLKEKFRSRKK